MQLHAAGLTATSVHSPAVHLITCELYLNSLFCIFIGLYWCQRNGFWCTVFASVYDWARVCTDTVLTTIPTSILQKATLLSSSPFSDESSSSEESSSSGEEDGSLCSSHTSSSSRKDSSPGSPRSLKRGTTHLYRKVFEKSHSSVKLKLSLNTTPAAAAFNPGVSVTANSGFTAVLMHRNEC